jgi:hypothetical protein
MASPADQRLLELLDKWLTSLDLHTQYSTLDDDSYWKIQPWIEHQRPNRWILDLAKQKTLALKAEVQERIKSGDARFSDSMELMIFLANLVGSEHIERFIPIAEPQNQASPPPNPAPPPQTAPDAGITGTREMPKFVVERQPAAAASANAGVARVERKAAGAKAGAKAAAKPAPKASAKSPALPPGSAQAAGVSGGAPSHDAHEQVIADAVRLVQWGRKWFELPELVARMAGRPPLAEVRRILKENKPAIEEKAKS